MRDRGLLSQNCGLAAVPNIPVLANSSEPGKVGASFMAASSDMWVTVKGWSPILDSCDFGRLSALEFHCPTVQFR